MAYDTSNMGQSNIWLCVCRLYILQPQSVHFPPLCLVLSSLRLNIWLVMQNENIQALLDKIKCIFIYFALNWYGMHGSYKKNTILSVIWQYYMLGNMIHTIHALPISYEMVFNIVGIIKCTTKTNGSHTNNI